MNTVAAQVVCLASSSPRRHQLLLQVGIGHRVLAADIDESVRPGESPHDYVRRLARAKAVAVAAMPAAGGLPVLGADTAVVIDTQILGKPSDDDHARRMLSTLAGREHQVLSAVALAVGAAIEDRVSVSRVRFAPLSPLQIDRYVVSGEPRGKAGGYAIQGLAAAFIERIDGSYSGVMGLPLFETCELLASAGLR